MKQVGLRYIFSIQKRSLNCTEYIIEKFPCLESVVCRCHAVHERVRASDGLCNFEDAESIYADVLKEEYTRQFAAGVVADIPDNAPCSRY